jgi:hypothetical protein
VSQQPGSATCRPLFQPRAGCWVYAGQREFCERPRFEVTLCVHCGGGKVGDLMSVLLATRLDGEPLTEPQMLSHLMTLMSNGGTTRLLLASLV